MKRMLDEKEVVTSIEAVDDGIKVNKLDGTSDTVEVGGGTEVVANPTLAGTEATLTGLQVGDTKYAVPGGHLYKHNISMQCSFTIGSATIANTIHVTIFNNSSTPIAKANFSQACATYNGVTLSPNKDLQVFTDFGMRATDLGTEKILFGNSEFVVHSTSNYWYISMIGSTSGIMTKNQSFDTMTDYQDIVVQIL